MHYDALHYWSKFQNNLSTFQWFTSSWSSSKLYFLLVWKSFICSIFLNKILQHPKINSASAPGGSWEFVRYLNWMNSSTASKFGHFNLGTISKSFLEKRSTTFSFLLLQWSELLWTCKFVFSRLGLCTAFFHDLFSISRYGLNTEPAKK